LAHGASGGWANVVAGRRPYPAAGLSRGFLRLRWLRRGKRQTDHRLAEEPRRLNRPT